MSNKLSVSENLSISKPLHAFLLEWLLWATEEPVKDNRIFWRYAGLCTCLEMWVAREESLCHRFPDMWTKQGGLLYPPLYREMTTLFRETLPLTSKCYPFGEDNFDRRLLGDSQHRDPKRLEWVRAALELSIEEEH